MPLNLTELDARVNDNLTTQAAAPPPPPPSTTVTVQAPPSPPDNSAELQALRAEIDALKAARTAQDEALQSSKLKAAVAEARIPITGLHNGKDDLEIGKAVSAIGNARFHQKTLEEKLSMIGADPALAKTPTTELERYFGAKSKSTDAMSLARQSPARYSALRKVAKLRGIL
jgi:hypothetical protein